MHTGSDPRVANLIVTFVLIGMQAMASEFAAGSTIRVKDGVSAPDLPEHSIAGWTGTITQISGKKGAKKIFIEWDDETLNSMSEDYKQSCEERQLYHLMACLTEDDIESPA